MVIFLLGRMKCCLCGFPYIGASLNGAQSIFGYSRLQNRLRPFRLKKKSEHRLPHPFLADTVPPLTRQGMSVDW